VRLPDHPPPGGGDVVDELEHLVTAGVGGDDAHGHRDAGAGGEVAHPRPGLVADAGVGREHVFASALEDAAACIGHHLDQLAQLLPRREP